MKSKKKDIQAAATARKQDLKDSPEDEKRMKPETAKMNLPDAEEIPGQENVHIPPGGEMADTTISSADEEGEGVLDNPDDINTNEDSEVSAAEKKALRDASNKVLTRDQANLDSARLDNVDDEGEPLNEPTALDGSGLDVPGSELDDENEEIGEEDEENNPYSVDEENEDRD